MSGAAGEKGSREAAVRWATAGGWSERGSRRMTAYGRRAARWPKFGWLKLGHVNDVYSICTSIDYIHYMTICYTVYVNMLLV